MQQQMFSLQALRLKGWEPMTLDPLAELAWRFVRRWFTPAGGTCAHGSRACRTVNLILTKTKVQDAWPGSSRRPRRKLQSARCKAEAAFAKENVTVRTRYLVIGRFGNRDWVHTSFGRKIEKAHKYRDSKRGPIAIVAEDHWATGLPA